MIQNAWKPVTFGQLEGLLAGQHFISDSMRTKFQARLKNLHRLRYPLDFTSTKGKATIYCARHVLDMALAMEMTQLGLGPERIVGILAVNRFATLMATTVAASQLARDDVWEERDPPLEKSKQFQTIFLCFDPQGLVELTDLEPSKFGTDFDIAAASFFYANARFIEENIVASTMSFGRLSLINVTSIILNLATAMFPNDAEHRQAFYNAIVKDNSMVEESLKNDEVACDYLFKLLEYNGYGHDAEVLAHMLPESPYYKQSVEIFAEMMLISEEKMAGVLGVAEHYVRKVVNGDT